MGLRSGGWQRLSLSLLACLAPACASVDHVRVVPANADEVQGIRYYDSSVYLLVFPNPDGTLDMGIHYLPDPNRKMAVHPHSFAGKVDVTLDFEDGALKSAKSGADTTVVPKAILKAAEVFLGTLLDVGIAAPEPPIRPDILEVPPPHIYKILVVGDIVHFVGGPGNRHFEISLVETEKKGGQS